MRDLPKNSTNPKYNIWIAKVNSTNTNDRKNYAINILYMSKKKSMHVIHIIFHSQYDFHLLTFHKWNVFTVFWRIIFANFLHSTAGITLSRPFPRRLCTHQAYCLYLANLKALEPFSIGSPSRLFSVESALINKFSKTNKSELAGIGDAVMSCIDKIKT